MIWCSILFQHLCLQWLMKAGSDNGSVTAVNANPNETVRYTLDNQNWSNTGVFNLPVKQLHPYQWKSVLCQQPFSIQTGLLIQIQTFSAVCDNKGTLSDPADDVYHITLLVGNNLNVAGSFQLVGTNGFTGQYNYIPPIILTCPPMGLQLRLLWQMLSGLVLQTEP